MIIEQYLFFLFFSFFFSFSTMTCQSAVGVGGLNEDRNDFVYARCDYSAMDYAKNFSSYYDQQIHPLVAPNLNQENSIHTFEIGSENNPYMINLQQMYCNIDWRVVRRDGTPLDDTDKVSIVNNFSHSLFEQIDVSINGVQISDHARSTHFRSVLTNKLSICKEIKETHLKCDYYFDDPKNSKINITNESFAPGDNNGEHGIKERSAVIKNSKIQNSYFRPQFDLTTCERDLPGNTVLRLVFTLASSDFLLLHTAEKKYKVEIIKFEMEVARYKPPANIEKTIETKKKSGLFLPFTRTTVRKREVHVGIHDLILPRIIEGDQLPHMIIIVPLQNYQLFSADKNPYCWKSHNISKFSLLLNGSSKPLQPLEVTTKSEDIMWNTRAYKHCMRAIGWNETAPNNPGIDMDSWITSNFFMAWDLTDCFCAGELVLYEKKILLLFFFRWSQPYSDGWRCGAAYEI